MGFMWIGSLLAFSHKVLATVNTLCIRSGRSYVGYAAEGQVLRGFSERWKREMRLSIGIVRE